VEDGADDFMVFLNEFYRQYPEYRECRLYLTGESYAGKYIPAIAGRILKFNDILKVDDDVMINLSGIAICGAWTHPEAQILHYTEHAHKHGLIDRSQKDKADELMSKVIDLMKEGKMVESTHLWDDVAAFIYSSGSNFSPYDIRDLSGDYDGEEYFDHWLRLAEVREALHVGNRRFDDGVKVFQALRGDDMVSNLDHVPDILNRTRVLLFNGQFDWVCNHMGIETMLEHHLEWVGRKEYLASPQVPWYVDGVLAGYVRSAASLTHVLVVDAGHMVPSDQPMRTYQMISNFLNGKPMIH
jgi:carboxypeptidase C (cathepsin A)